MRSKIKAYFVLLVVAICLAYANSYDNGFHFDDFHTVTDNPAVRSLGNIPRFFTDATTFSVLPANRTYRPTVSTSLAIDYALGRGYVPLWFHVGTFLVFLLQVWLLFELYLLLMDKVRPAPENQWLALLGAAWFGLHPAMAETVNYVIQRGDIYCTIGCVGALLVYARYPAKRRYGLYLLPFVFALLSKPPAAVFPSLLLLYVFFFETDAGAGRWSKSFKAIVPALVMMGLLLWLQSAMTPPSFMPSILSPWDYRLTQPFVWLRYFGELFLPVHLNVDTDLGVFSEVNLRMVAGLAFLAGLVVAIWYTARRRVMYPIAFGLLWFVITQLPTSLYPLSEPENDHRMFFSFAGLMVGVIWAGWLVWLEAVKPERRATLQPVALGILCLALCGYAYGVHVRNAVWRDEETLWKDDAEKSPLNGRGLMIYGLTQMNKGDYKTALDYFERALKYTPNYATLEVNLGIDTGALADAGDASLTAEAEQHFQRAISLSGNDDTTHSFYARWLGDHGKYAEAAEQAKTAVELNPARPFPHELLIQEYQHLGDMEGAKEAAIETLRVVPDDSVALQALQHPVAQNADFFINLSLKQYQQKEYGASIESAKKALALDANSAAAYNNIGAAQAGLGAYAAAIASEREALKINPQMQIAQNNLAAYTAASNAPGGSQSQQVVDAVNESLRLNKAGEFEASIAAAQKALKLDPRCAEAWNNIAADDEGMSRWDAAIAAAKRAIDLKPDFQLAKNNLAWSEQQKKLVGK